MSPISNNLVLDQVTHGKNVLVVKQNFSSRRDKPFMLILLPKGPGGYGVPLSQWLVCLPPGNYGSQCQSMVKSKELFIQKLYKFRVMAECHHYYCDGNSNYRW